MSQQDDFERILASLYEAMLDDLHWNTTSALIDEACGTEGNALVFAGMTPAGEAEILFARFCHRGQRDREFEQEYFRVYYPVDERLPRFRQLPDSKIVHVKELLSEQERKKSILYNELLVRRQAQDSLYTRMDGPYGSRIGLVIDDPVDSRGWSSAQIDMIRGLLPHLRQFVRVRHALVECGALGTPLGELLENSLAGVIQLDRHGRIVASNDRALELLRDGDVLSDEDGTLSASSLEDNPELQRLLARALPPFGDQGESGSMVVKHATGAPSMALHVIPRARSAGRLPDMAYGCACTRRRPKEADPDRSARAEGDTRPYSGRKRSRGPPCRGPFRPRNREGEGPWRVHGTGASQANLQEAPRFPSDGHGADRAGDRWVSPA